MQPPRAVVQTEREHQPQLGQIAHLVRVRARVRVRVRVRVRARVRVRVTVRVRVRARARVALASSVLREACSALAPAVSSARISPSTWGDMGEI